MKKITKIALINPKKPIWSRNENTYNCFLNLKDLIRPWYTPPLSLLSIASVTPAEILIDFIDNDFDEIDYSVVYDLVGITAMTQQISDAFNIADHFRSLKTPVIIGGIHPSVLAEECLEHADFVMVGEAEELWPTFLDDFEKNHTKKIYINKPGYQYDLTKSPKPRFDLIKKNNLKRGENFFNLMPIQATRGCPHNCSFCSVSKILGKKIRKKNIDQIINEILYVKELFGNHLIVFVDDNFFADKTFAKNLLIKLIPLKIRWFAQTDISIAFDPELLKLAYNSGCLMVLIGLESLSANSLQSINNNQWKAKQITKYENAISTIHMNGIIVYAAFILGFENDNLQTFQEIRDFMVKNNCVGQFTLLTPLPGTDLYTDYKDRGLLIKDKFWDMCTFFDVVIRNKNLSKKQIEENLIWLYNEIYNINMAEKRIQFLKEIYKKLPARWIE